MIALEADISEIEDLLTVLKVLPNGLEKATSRAINRTLVSTRAYMAKTIREDYAIKAGDIRKELVIKKAWWSQLYGSISGSGSPGLPLMDFVRGSKAAPSTKKLKNGAYRPSVGVPVLIRKDKGKIAVRGGFIAKMPNGHVGIFRRADPSKTGRKLANSQIRIQQTALADRYIKELHGPSPIRILSSDYYDEKIEDFSDETLQKNFQHEADYVLKQMGLR